MGGHQQSITEATTNRDSAHPEKQTNGHDYSQDNDSSPEKQDHGSPGSSYFQLWSFATPLDVFLRCLAGLAAAGSGTAEPLMALIFGNLVNLFNGNPPVSPEEFRSSVNKNSLYFVYLFIGKFACVYISAVLFNFTASRMTSKIRLRYLSKVLHQPISYFDKNTPGTIATSLANDTNIVQVGLSEKLGIVFQVTSMILCSFVVAFTRSWKLTLVTATSLPYLIIVVGFFGGMSANVEAKVNEILNQASGIAEEALSSILNIAAMGASEKIVRRFDVQVKSSMPHFRRIGPLQAIIYGNMFFAVYCAYSLSLFYGAKLVNRGEITRGGDVVVVLFCMILASSAMGFLAPLIPDFTKASAAAQQIIRVIGSPKEQDTIKDDEHNARLEALRGDIELHEISFSYPERPEVTVLDNISLNIPSNKVTALVGHSGSGKSTIVGLLERWYDYQQGTLLIDGQDITNLDLDWWRTQVGLVQQEPMLFNDTIYHNVLNGLRGPSFDNISDAQKRELVIAACKQSNAHDFIQQLPKGYDTPAGERAGMLSGGQKQRIAIARSIISNPKVLLLDEATSALDSESERAVSAALEIASQGRTTVMIAHKLATVVNADNIVVLNKGTIVEQGTHLELLALNGHYCRLLQAQGSSDNEKGKQKAVEDEETSQKLSRNLTRQSTKGALDPLSEMTSPLESAQIARAYGIFHCIYLVYAQHPSLIFPSIISFAAAVMAGASFPLQAFMFSRLVSIFQAQGSELTSRGNFWALMFFVLGIEQLISYMILFYLLGNVSAKISQYYRRNYFRAMLAQDVGFFQAGGNTSGGLTALLSADGENMTMLFAMSSGIIVVFTTCLIACCILSLAVYWKLGLVGVFGCLPVLLGAGFLRMRIDLTAQDRCAAAFLESARYSTEAVAAIRTISSLTMEGKVESMYHDKLNSASAATIKKTLVSMILYALSDALSLAAGALVFWYGGRLVSFGELSSTQFFIIFSAIIFGGQSAGFMFGFTSSKHHFVLFYAERMVTCTIQVCSISHQGPFPITVSLGTNKAHAAMNRIFYLIKSKPPINSSTGKDPSSSSPPPNTPTIEFRNVHFRYPSRPTVPVLRGLSLSINRGSHVAIVGSSGCGKSTVIALLERFYDLQTANTDTTAEQSADSGEILLYDSALPSWDIHKLRSRFGLVAQETTLYQGTIRDNILLGIDETTLSSNEEDIQSRIETACKQANIHTFITSLPQSYSTSIGSRGVALSGGQRQRLALARCLIRNPDILLLDEATSALDPESEKSVREALRKARKEREDLTVISVTHQVEGMKEADKIFVIEKGVVVEEGHWEELVGKRGRLWGMVVKGEVEGGNAPV
ncbi:multidrug resistance protein 14 [Dendryphion nanum]|uniref:Multidrug resistance protein 14 n=1 Tax=Dendryphion nanum TaxID=256645 RepID=A0A9P9DSB1_9PLEO|nr:multidrug resistance protein 14 [Dendryphion nanum]